MAFTAYRTWVHGEIVTGSMLTEQLSANGAIIKTTRNDVGKVVALNSTYIDSLDSSALTGLARPGQANVFLGVNSFAAAHFLIPVGADKWAVATGGGKEPGSLWTQGDYLYHVASDGKRWKYLGELVSASPTAAPGNVAINATYVHYVSENGGHRRCWTTVVRAANVATPYGTFGLSGNYLHVVDNAHTVRSLYSPPHVDTPHSNTDGTPHTDIPHTNTDPPHDDVDHDDTPHVNTFGPAPDYEHDNVPHANTDHVDTDPPHENVEHDNAPETPHENTEAQNIAGLDQPVKVDP